MSRAPPTTRLRRASQDAVALAVHIRQLTSSKPKITLLRNPISTLCHFSHVAFRFFCWVLIDVFGSPAMLYAVFPLLALVFALCLAPGPHEAYVIEVVTWARVVIWWMGLGILSSIGLGSGMHTGLIFLVPHLYFIAASADYCRNLDFDWRLNMWTSQLQPGQHFECRTPYDVADSVVTFPRLLLLALPAALLWGLGTAIGELPPYAAAYVASKTRTRGVPETGAAIDCLDEEGEGSMIRKCSCYTSRRLKRCMARCTVFIITNYGSVAVFVLSAFPNVFFDFVGIVCGHFLMPFSRFFPALLLGKGIFKPLVQCCFLLFVFSNQFTVRYHANIFDDVRDILAEQSSWLSTKLATVLTDVLGDNSHHQRLTLQLLPSALDSIVVPSRAVTMIFVVQFVLSLVQQIAQLRQNELDEEEARRQMGTPSSELLQMGTTEATKLKDDEDRARTPQRVPRSRPHRPHSASPFPRRGRPSPEGKALPRGSPSTPPRKIPVGSPDVPLRRSERLRKLRVGGAL